MHFELTEDQKILQRTTRKFSDEEIWPYSTEWDDKHIFPVHVFKKMGEMGLMGLLIPEEYGGSGGTLTDYVVAMEEISRGCPSVGLTWGGHMSIGTQPIVMFGNGEQKKRYLPKLASGEYIGAFGLTEPNAGSDAGGIQTTAVLNGDEWMINGSKCFISNPGTEISYGVVILAKTGEREGGKKEFTCFIVEKGTPGYTVGKHYEKMAWMSGDTHELIFEDCQVPKENLLGERGRGLAQMLAALDVGRVGFAASSLGLAQRSYELALGHAQERVQFGNRLASYQLIQSKIANMVVNIEAARLLDYKAAWLADNGQRYGLEAAVAKYYASEVASKTVDEAAQIFGGYGFMKEYPINRLYRIARILKIGEGANEVLQTMVIARSVGCY